MRRALVVLGLSVLCGNGCGGEEPRAPGPGTLPDRSRRALSARLDAALARDDLEESLRALDALREAHDGRSETPSGRERTSEATHGAVFDAAVAGARRAIDGPAPDRARAERALAVARDLAPALDDDASRAALAAARRWVGLTSLSDLKTPLAPHAGPRVLVAADGYDLVEPPLSVALARWVRLGETEGLRVAVLPLHRGFVRMGTRRTRAKDRDEERAELAASIAGLGVVQEPEPDAAAAASDLGLLGMDAAVLVVDREGRIAARLAGRDLDPAPLTAVVQKVLSR